MTLANVKTAFDTLFYWVGVWTVMVGGTWCVKGVVMGIRRRTAAREEGKRQKAARKASGAASGKTIPAAGLPVPTGETLVRVMETPAAASVRTSAASEKAVGTQSRERTVQTGKPSAQGRLPVRQPGRIDRGKANEHQAKAAAAAE